MAKYKAFKEQAEEGAERERLVASIYKSVTKTAVSQVKDKLREWGIPMASDDRATRPRLVPLPKDIKTISSEKMFRYYQDAWLIATPGCTPRAALPVAPWAHCQKAATEIDSNFSLNTEEFESFKRTLADKMDLEPEQLNIIIEAVTPRGDLGTEY